MAELSRKESGDSSLNLRLNPLNIRNSDGSDFFVDKARLRSIVNERPSSSRSSSDLLVNSMLNSPVDEDLPPSLRIEREKQRRANRERELEAIKNEEHELQESKRLLEIEKARLALEGAGTETAKQDLNQQTVAFPEIASQDHPKPSNDKRSSLMLHIKNQQNAESKIFKLLDVNLDDGEEGNLSTQIMDEFEEMSITAGLARSNTITSQHKVQIGPSQTPLLFSRPRGGPREKISEVNELEDVDSLAIPTPLLNAISFTPRVPLASNRDSTCASLTSSTSSTRGSKSDSEFHTPMEPDSMVFESRTSSKKDPVPVACPAQATPKIHSKSPLLFEPHHTEVVNGEPSLDTDSIYDDPNEVEPASPEVESSPTMAELDPVDPNDRGRLFIKINALQELQLPMDYGRNPHFTMTLDNGLQSVRTYPIRFPETTKEAGINQEFELLVGDKLELILTFTGHMDPLPVEKKQEVSRSVPSSPTKSTPESPKKKRFSFFSSPKKKKHQSNLNVSAPVDAPIATPAKTSEPASKDVWKHFTGENGEFARAYIDEGEFERDIYGKPKTYLISCFNEWTMEKVPLKDGTTGTIRGMKMAKKPPFRIGGLQVTMMYVPKVTRNETIPKSMKECVTELQKALQFRDPRIQGNLTQQGGDCNYWRRRWFTLEGDSLTGHTEEGHKVRNIINMGNVRQLIEMDKVQDEEDPCINAERAFRLIFKDGEKVSFYADSVEEKNLWVQNIGLSMVHCCGKIRNWVDMVFQNQEEEEKVKSNFAARYNYHLHKTMKEKQSKSRFVECDI